METLGTRAFRARQMLGLSTATVAGLLKVSTRTVAMWEAGTQQMPEGRWRLLVHEIKSGLVNLGHSVVVVLGEQGEPIDVVSDANFFDIRVNDFDGSAVIASHAIDRYTQRPYLHQQRFKIAGNEHVIAAAHSWNNALREGATTGEQAVLTLHRWMTNRVLEAEHKNPNIRNLKQRIAEATEAVDRAKDEPGSVLLDRLKDQDDAIWALIQEVERHRTQG